MMQLICHSIHIFCRYFSAVSLYCYNWLITIFWMSKLKKNYTYSMHFISEFDLDLSDIAETAVMGVYVIVGLVVGGIILLIIVVVIVICCCCKRQGASSGQVYRNQQPASQPVSQPPPSAYPQVQYSAVSPQAAGYQPPPAHGYNPTPQGYNPPTGQMAGYPPQAGYQPPPQGYGAPPPAQGYQMAETQKMPSGRVKYESSPLFYGMQPLFSSTARSAKELL